MSPEESLREFGTRGFSEEVIARFIWGSKPETPIEQLVQVDHWLEHLPLGLHRTVRQVVRKLKEDFDGFLFNERSRRELAASLSRRCAKAARERFASRGAGVQTFAPGGVHGPYG